MFDVKSTPQERHEQLVGVWYTIAAFFLWGILPLYWKALRAVPSTQILAHRIIWSCVFVTLLLVIRKRMPQARRAFSSKRNRLFFTLSALCIGINWFIYIWAVNANRIVETSMGYFINPLVSVLLGMIFLRERLGFWQVISVLLAFSGVLYMTLQYGSLPWIALSLALSFGFYGLLRKTSHADSLIGLLYETVFLSPLALLYLVIIGLGGKGAFGREIPLIHLLLISSGVVTAIPLIWFANGARRIPLSTVGFTQYLAPSLMLFLGTVVFREPFTRTHLISFSLIWGALCLFSLSHTAMMRRVKPSFFRKEDRMQQIRDTGGLNKDEFG
jgi:chloramphenicol-sensitive protein RarD